MTARRMATGSGPVKLSLLTVAALVPLTLPLWSGGRALLHWCRMQLSAAGIVGAQADWLWQAPLALLVAGLIAAAADRAVSEWQLRRFLKRHRWRPAQPGEPAYEVARELGIAGAVRILEGPCGSPVFTAHLRNPRVYIAQRVETDTVLTPRELRAVLRHEAAHLRRLDPLRLAGLRFLRRLLFWIPAFGPQEERYRWRLEELADEAARTEGDVTLAAAIVKVARLADPLAHPPVTVPAFYAPSTVEWRVRRLLGQPQATPLRGPGRLRLAASGAAIVLVWASLLLGAAPHDQHRAVHSDPSPVVVTEHYCKL